MIKLILEATPDISLSEDPSFIFNYINSGGPLEVYLEDSEGQKFWQIQFKRKIL